MRLLLVLTVVVVFAALMMFDTTALFQLTWYCATGGCGVNPLWIVVAVGAVVVAVMVSRWRPKGKVKRARTGKTAPRRAARAKTGVKKKPARSK